ncbi:PREDICTED: receptor-like protein 2 [Fragaria vesca subsp. vesca]|uniref:receptor-like protein 2 n=1 Tax=Fragaria vesca subsp. vesca TaxID=101020 RepID=UPI0002C37150|nr:PREDICTED: receptor-like protein 2 [Fragaria vesca subsp. vesca]
MFSGSIPSSVCHHPSPLIRVLDFSFNLFNGSLSSGLGECSKLEVFRAGYNNISGILPEDIYNIAKLEEFAMPFNSLDGVIGDRIVNLTNLAILDLHVNQLRDMLPLNFGNLTKLKLLLLHWNNLEGFLPPSLMNCTNLIELNLLGNQFQGDISTLNFSKLTQLAILDLLSNNLNGSLPMSLYSCKSLKAIRRGINDIEGQIQPEILSLKSLSFLSISHGRLSNITKAINILKHSKSLVFLSFVFSFEADEESPADFGITHFEGFQSLRFLNLRGCNLASEIPKWLSKVKNLAVLSLADNKITGSVPKLRHNSFYGSIPVEIGQLDRLQSLWLNHNNFTGNIPTQISDLKNLNALQLSENHLSGHIPSSLSSLNFLSNFNVSFNNLEGQIPKGTQIQGFDVSAFEGNPKLCGCPLPNECHANKGLDDQDMDNNYKHRTPWFYVPAGLGFVVGFWGVWFIDFQQDMEICLLPIHRKGTR